MSFARLKIEQRDMVAELLIFRLLYYVVPLALPLVNLGVRELWLGVVPKS